MIRLHVGAGAPLRSTLSSRRPLFDLDAYSPSEARRRLALIRSTDPLGFTRVTRTPRSFWGPVMAQTTLRRRGTGSCPTWAERPDGTPADGGHPQTTDGLRVAAARQQRVTQSLIYVGGAAFVIAGSGLVLVGVRRRLW